MNGRPLKLTASFGHPVRCQEHSAPTTHQVTVFARDRALRPTFRGYCCDDCLGPALALLKSAKGRNLLLILRVNIKDE